MASSRGPGGTLEKLDASNRACLKSGRTFHRGSENFREIARFSWHQIESTSTAKSLTQPPHSATPHLATWSHRPYQPQAQALRAQRLGELPGRLQMVSFFSVFKPTEGLGSRPKGTPCRAPFGSPMGPPQPASAHWTPWIPPKPRQKRLKRSKEPYGCKPRNTRGFNRQVASV